MSRLYGCYIFKNYLSVNHRASKHQSQKQDRPGWPWIWVLDTLSHSPLIAGSSSVAVDTVCAPVTTWSLPSWATWFCSTWMYLCPAMHRLGCGSEIRLLGIFVSSQLRIRSLKLLAYVALGGGAAWRCWEWWTNCITLPAGAGLSLAFSKAVSLVHIRCLRLEDKKKKPSSMKFLWV